MDGRPIGRWIWEHNRHRDYLDVEPDHSDPEGGSHGQRATARERRRWDQTPADEIEGGLYERKLAHLLHLAEHRPRQNVDSGRGKDEASNCPVKNEL